MITRSPQLRQVPLWQQQLNQCIRDPAELFELLELDERLLPAARQAAGLFKLRVPRGFVARMKKGDLNDPLLRQVLPLGQEMEHSPGYATDPVGDLRAMPITGLLHKYRGRALLVITGACAVHCRYCFRRHFPYAQSNPMKDHWTEVLNYLDSDPSINEIILSGGDPLMLTDRRLTELTSDLQQIPHLRCLRLHTRLPVVLPSRIDTSLLDWLNTWKMKKVIVIHANHANEIDDSVSAAMSRLASNDVTLLNQAVLLRGINDDAVSLKALSVSLFEIGVLPYYLHLLDRVQGAAHFAVSCTTARRLIDELNGVLPGYLVPRLVYEEAGAGGKTPLTSNNVGPCMI